MDVIKKFSETSGKEVGNRWEKAGNPAASSLNPESF
jgi:hypothetical protein